MKLDVQCEDDDLETLCMCRGTLNLEILGSERMRGTSLCRSVQNEVKFTTEHTLLRKI